MLATDNEAEVLTRLVSERLKTLNGMPLGEPTKHMPGTPEKLAVLAERYCKKLCLWHPLDAGEHLWIEKMARMGLRVDNGRDLEENQVVFTERRASL